MSDAQDPLDFIKNMWGNMGFGLPGMVTPTFDSDELDKRISELKTVEGWLKTNLGLLQMTIQGLEMQRATLAAVRAMSASMSESMNDSASTPDAANANPFASAALWQWPFAAQGGTPTSPAESSPTGSSPAEPAAKPAARPRASRAKKKSPQ